MLEDPSRPPKRRRNILVRAYRGLNSFRRFTVNIVFLLLLVLILRAIFSGPEGVDFDGAALVIRPVGFLTEELYGDPRERALMRLLGNEPDPEALMGPLIGAIEAAVDDDRIEVIYLDLTRLFGGGMTKLQRLGAALQTFSESGKKIIATADAYSQAPYYLASFADEVYLHEMGVVFIQGLGSYRNYYRDAIDKLEIDWNIFRVGEFKSAVEPYLRNDMSDEARAARLEWLSSLWEAYKSDVAAARGLEVEDLENYMNRFDEVLKEADGDAAIAALRAGLVDEVVQRDELRQRMVDLVGESDDGLSFQQVDHEAYWRATKPATDGGNPDIAVVVATGTILDGKQGPGRVGGDSTAELIRQAREDDDVAALVLRVDSPGGSVFASEVIRREVELTKLSGKPVIASMGSVAASGGYWISMPADEIWAQPTTITGSIGVFAMFPTFERTLAKIGVSTDGVGTTPFADILRLDRSLSPEAASIFQLTVEKDYRQFIEKVAEYRGRPVEEIDAIARGRVWSGAAAHELGLVDRLGTLEDAIASAAVKADLGERHGVRYFTQPVSPFEAWLEELSSQTLGRWIGKKNRLPVVGGRAGLGALFSHIERDLEEVVQWNDPFAAYAYCFCDVE